MKNMVNIMDGIREYGWNKNCFHVESIKNENNQYLNRVT